MLGMSELTFTITRSGKPVTDLQPYLGAYGHLVALGVGDLAYLHVHPEVLVARAPRPPGLGSPSMPRSPLRGQYRLFLDFKAGGLVATAGSTNLALVDDLASVPEVCRRHGVWLHVDGADGGAAFAAPSARHRFAGMKHADSLIGDPHKWLFAPFDACALVYRDPKPGQGVPRPARRLPRGAVWGGVESLGLRRPPQSPGAWPAPVVLSRRLRRAGLCRRNGDCLRAARQAAEFIKAAPHVELVLEPELSVVVLRRIGWREDDYRAWSLALLRRGDGFAVPSAHGGEPVLRLCIVNTRSTAADIAVVLDSMR